MLCQFTLQNNEAYFEGYFEFLQYSEISFYLFHYFSWHPISVLQNTDNAVHLLTYSMEQSPS